MRPAPRSVRRRSRGLRPWSCRHRGGGCARCTGRASPCLRRVRRGRARPAGDSRSPRRRRGRWRRRAGAARLARAGAGRARRRGLWRPLTTQAAWCRHPDDQGKACPRRIPARLAAAGPGHPRHLAHGTLDTATPAAVSCSKSSAVQQARQRLGAHRTRAGRSSSGHPSSPASRGGPGSIVSSTRFGAEACPAPKRPVSRSSRATCTVQATICRYSVAIARRMLSLAARLAGRMAVTTPPMAARMTTSTRVR